MSQRVADTGLRQRQQAEALFHDRKYATGDAFPRHYQANPTYPVFQRMLAMLGPDLSNVRILEYGCGTGWITQELARQGARVSAFDISPEAVAQTQTVLAAAGLLHRCDVRVMAGEKLEYEANTFDVAVGFAILHHLDVPLAVEELHRVLRPGGRAVFAEPLASNPLIRLYRWLTPQYRTADEAPLHLGRFRKQVLRFSRVEHRGQLLFAAAALVLCYLPGLSAAAPRVQRWLTRLDDLVLTAAPWAGRWAWYTIITCRK